MNKNPLNINFNQPKWETPSIYSVEIDKVMMTNEGESPGIKDDGGNNPGSSGLDSLNPSTTSLSGSTDYNPFDYNSFDENPFAE